LFFKVFILLLAIHSNFARADSEQVGDVLSLLIPSIAMGGTVFFEEDREGSVEFLKAFATSQFLTEGLKRTIHKERPNGRCCKSFPSGHSSRAFLGASFIHKRYGFKYSIPAYIAAIYVGSSRIDAKQHRIEDVLGGALIGMLSSYYFVDPYKGVKITPVASRNFYGVALSRSF
tara:strand:+ start:930 stop:1451 length:522 start_codon:yes stop_codon:yes gene_type:complete